MKLGFTGTREDMTGAQNIQVLELVKRLSVTEAHHGDCVGADREFHSICRLVSLPRVEGINIVIHPPLNPALRAFCQGDVMRTAKGYFERSMDIVGETSALIVAPKQMQKPKSLRGSGTWQTEDYAEGRTLVYIVWPDGRVEIRA